MKKMLVGMTATLALSSVLAGCSGGAEEGQEGAAVSQEEVEQEITVNAMTEPPTLDPALSTDTTSFWILDHMFEGLYTQDKEGEAVLGVAEDVNISEDGTVYTFTIREDAVWSDGTPVTAENFEYAWKRVLDPATASAFAFYLYYIEGAEAYNKGEGSVEDVAINAVDERTLEVTLNSPLGYFDKLLTQRTFLPLKQEVVEADPNWAAGPETYISNGPFELTEWSHNEQVVIEKNEEYFNADQIDLQQITFEMVNDATTYYQMFKTDELDFIMTLPPDALDAEKDNPEFQSIPYYGTYMYMFNVEQEPFTNQKVRKAFAMAIDRESLTENVSRAGESPAYAMVPTGVTTPEGDFREEGGAYFEEDYEEAKRLLEEGMAEEGWDTLPEVTLMYNTSENHKKFAEAVQEMLKQNLGVEVQLANQEWKTYLETTEQGNFQMARMGWIGSFIDPVANLDYYLGDSPNNRTNWVNEDYDRLIAEAKVEQDEAKRFELLHQAEEILMTDLPFMPVYFYTNTYMTDSDIEDVAYYVNSYPSFKWAQVVPE
ncbi:peptide ABC transporter substrate-binding protein [Planococcus lenghuensis]|uniref:ABC transporter substrate-binding protein n=1 Tax=Planococcus lenghuensis TaxID=2213202 RepID=A0A1Q2L2G0_9BACL|nr:peptide ABC transporter substrate-binding protein [Planococcus lenghuensis]AQQ54593.1 ABC transporter substrate-binding protein [Planococcus lenghuensis]